MKFRKKALKDRDQEDWKVLIFSAQLEVAELTLCHHGRRSIS